MDTEDEYRLAIALRILADAWETQRRGPFASMQLEGRMERLPDLSLDAAVVKSEAAKALIARIDALDAANLPAPIAAALAQARYGADVRQHAGDWYWTVVDPADIGFYGLFLPTGYCGGFLLNFVFGSLAGLSLAKSGDLDRHLGLLDDLAALVDQMTARTRGQAERGMFMPRPQIPAARALVAGFGSRLRPALSLEGTSVPPAFANRTVSFRAEVARRIEQQLEPAFDRLASVFDATYEAAAPDAVGLSQYPGGAAIYRELIRMHTTLPLSPEEVHATGLRRLETIEADMRSLRATVGLEHDAAGYLDRARADPRYAAATSADVAAVFQRYIDRMDGVFDRAFHARSRTPHGVAPLPDALQATMTFGYYDAARPGHEIGRFLFNASHLTKSTLVNVAALTYHELVPGHHQHLASQSENEALHPVGRFAFCNAFNEGWAEYAATLAGELGLYAEPEERYGRLMMDAFLTSRLVVDTGMNALGWTLEEARDFMRRLGTTSEAEIRSETLRYACDIPAQALAYKLGDTEILRLRERMRSLRGPRFDVRDFHAAVLQYGAMPLPALAAHVERIAARAT